ncbi:polysaccharide pyruvyl transferase family protein [Flavobacterium sp. WC2409]|uniref:Polysaccharide pyruvyl transferase family protein n=1 Tax=Flavobacterium sp. WC2409 TaxID=3234139 RepID=A0AB39W478_9FLAO
MKKKILYIIATQYDNMGDLLINKCLIDELANYGNVYLDTKKVPADFKKILLEHPNTFELSAISNFSFKGKGLLLVPFIKHNKYSHLFKSPGPFGGAKTVNDKIRYLIFYYLFFIMKRKGAESYLIGNDLIVKSKFDAWVFRKFSFVLERMFVRSKKNVEIFKELQISNVGYVPDLCFLMNSEDKSSEKNKVGVSFRDLENGVLHEKIVKSIKEMIVFYSNKSYQIEFFYQVERDCLYNENLYNLFKEMPNVSFRKGALTWEQRDFYKDVDAVLSNRLHVLLLAQSYNSIPMALIDDNAKTIKIKDIYESIGLEDFIYSDLSSNQIKFIYSSKVNLKSRIIDVNQAQKVIFKNQLESIFK